MSMREPIPLADIQAARERLVGSAIRTPLVRLNVTDAPAEIYLKLENLQPIGSFKIRGAGNAIALATKEQLADGVYTAASSVGGPVLSTKLTDFCSQFYRVW